MAAPRPYVLLSAAMSVDGYIDDTTPERLRLSDEEDFDRVDQVRAESDAILIGATTLRRDNPRLIVKSPARQADRQTRGLPACPLKVVVTASGDISPDLRFFHSAGDRLIYCPEAVAPKLRDRIGDLAEVADVGASLDFAALVDDLGERGVRQLMVEGGTTIHTQFLTAGLADEIHLAVAPCFVGDTDAPRIRGGPGTSRMATPGAWIPRSWAQEHLTPALPAQKPGRSGELTFRASGAAGAGRCQVMPQRWASPRSSGLVRPEMSSPEIRSRMAGRAWISSGLRVRRRAGREGSRRGGLRCRGGGRRRSRTGRGAGGGQAGRGDHTGCGDRRAGAAGAYPAEIGCSWTVAGLKSSPWSRSRTGPGRWTAIAAGSGVSPRMPSRPAARAAA